MLTVTLAFAVVLTTAGGNAFAQKKTAKHAGAKDYEIVKVQSSDREEIEILRKSC